MLLRFSLTVWVLAALASLVASQAYPITGVQVAAGSAVPYRKNINILYKNGGAPWYVQSAFMHPNLSFCQDLPERLTAVPK